MRCILLLLVLSSITYKASVTFQVEKVIRVYDGDTFHVNLKGVHPFFGDTIGIRIKDIDTPEIRGSSPCLKKKAYAARDYLKNLLSKAKEIELRNCRKGKYFRIVADVYADNQSLSHLLLNEGYAKPYNGGKKTAWTCQN